jgi:BASS family bile acid:Na+ symporter
MESGILADVLLPLAIVLIMIAMGMTLTGIDFRRLATQPKAIGVGLISQLILLPAIAFAVAGVFGLATTFALSMILLAASPGGSTSNLIVHMADADRPLSITLTAISNVVAFVTLPIYITIAQNVFGNLPGEATVPAGDLVVQIAALTVVPIAIGMFIRAKRPDFADRAEEPGKIISTAVLGIIILGLVIQNWDSIVDEGPEFAPAFITMNLLALAGGTLLATGAKLGHRQVTTVGLETGIQNATITIAIALAVFESDDLATVPGLYGLWMLVTGFAYAFMRRRSQELADIEAPVT